MGILLAEISNCNSFRYEQFRKHPTNEKVERNVLNLDWTFSSRSSALTATQNRHSGSVHAKDSGFRVLDSGILVGGTWIPDSNHQWGSRFQSLVGFQIPIISGIPDSTANICWIQDSTSKNFADSGIRIPLHRAISAFEQVIIIHRSYISAEAKIGSFSKIKWRTKLN